MLPLIPSSTSIHLEAVGQLQFDTRAEVREFIGGGIGAANNHRVIRTDVFIVGSGPIVFVQGSRIIMVEPC